MKYLTLLVTCTLALMTSSVNAKIYLASEIAAEVQPIVRIEPRYPAKAARDGITGYVKLKFVVTEFGSVSDVEVTESVPEQVFDRQAIKAVQKWKYKPSIVDGKAVKVWQETQLDFRLSQ